MSGSTKPQAPPLPPAPFEQVQYGDHPLQTYIHFTPPNFTSTVIFIHGGAYRHPPLPPQFDCSSAAGLPLLSALHARFPTARLVSVGYRLLRHPKLGCVEPPATSWKDCLADVESALNRLGADPGAGGGVNVLVGHSVGAFLAGKVRRIIAPAKVIGVEGIYDFVDFCEEYKEYCQWVYDAMGPMEEAPEEWRINGVEVKIHSEEDELLSVRQSMLGKGRSELILLKNGSHDGVLRTAEFIEAVGNVLNEWFDAV